MTMKKFDLVKNLALKLDGKMKQAGVPDRFAQGAAAAVDKRERRARDAAAGLVPFACKLPAAMAQRLSERAQSHEGGLNALVAELIEASLGADEGAAPAAKAAKPAKADKAEKAEKTDKSEKAPKAEKPAAKSAKAAKGSSAA